MIKPPAPPLKLPMRWAAALNHLRELVRGRRQILPINLPEKKTGNGGKKNYKDGSTQNPEFLAMKIFCIINKDT